MIEDALIAAIEAAPEDLAPRIVYADWLAERGDPRAELVMLATQLWQTPIDPRRVCRLYLRRDDLACDPRWLARIERPSFAEIGELTELVSLSITDTAVHRLPDSMARLRKLRSLLCTHVPPLAALPDWIGELTELRELSLSHCGLSTLPASIGALQYVLDLELQDNTLVALPAAIGRMKLRSLSLQDNQLTSLPGEMVGLVGLEQLDLSHNQLHELPGWISELPCLESIGLNAMPLDLADTFRKLARIPTLRNVQLNGAGHTELPPEVGLLTQINNLALAGNQIRALPAELARLTDLIWLSFHNNPLPPGAVARLQLPNLRFDRDE